MFAFSCGDYMKIITLPNGATIEGDEYIPTEAEQAKLDIVRKLARLDQLSDSPRARREALLGNTAWLQSLDTQAAALRAELAGL